MLASSAVRLRILVRPSALQVPLFIVNAKMYLISHKALFFMGPSSKGMRRTLGPIKLFKFKAQPGTAGGSPPQPRFPFREADLNYLSYHLMRKGCLNDVTGHERLGSMDDGGKRIALEAGDLHPSGSLFRGGGSLGYPRAEADNPPRLCTRPFGPSGPSLHPPPLSTLSPLALPHPYLPHTYTLPSITYISKYHSGIAGML
jgi:hypothetical protein